jgi:D-3-phosphoglycerate dehydrogenase
MPFRKYRVATISSSDFPVRIDIVRQALSDLAKVSAEELPFRPLSEEEEERYGNRLADYDGLLVRSGIFTKGLLRRLQSARVIVIHGAGVDQVDVAAAERLGIYVANAPGGNANAVVELTIGLMVDLARRVSLSSFHVRRDGQWGKSRYLGNELCGRRLGLLGFGRIGARVATLARAFGMTVLSFDPYVPSSDLKTEGITSCSSPEDLLTTSDIVSLHMPLQQETYHFINETRIKKMRRGAFLINTARGALVDEKALYNALVSGHLGGAALDVLEQEPPVQTNPLLSLEQVIITPHLGGSTQEALNAIAQIAAEQIRSVLEGGKPTFAVNRPKLS